MKTAIEKLEALFYNEADPTINSNSWVIHERALKKIILNAMEIEKEQIIDAYKEGCFDNILDETTDTIRAKNYYKQTYNQNKS